MGKLWLRNGGAQESKTELNGGRWVWRHTFEFFLSGPAWLVNIY